MIDRDSFHAITLGRSDAAREIADLFKQDAQRILAEMHCALSAGEDQTLKRLGHTLKSTCGTLGAGTGQELGLDMERQGLVGAHERLQAIETNLPQIFACLEQIVAELSTRCPG